MCYKLYAVIFCLWLVLFRSHRPLCYLNLDEETAKPVNLIISCTHAALNADTALWILTVSPNLCCCLSFLSRCSIILIDKNLYWNVSVGLNVIVTLFHLISFTPYSFNWPCYLLLWCVSVCSLSLFFFTCQIHWLYSKVYGPWWIGC